MIFQLNTLAFTKIIARVIQAAYDEVPIQEHTMLDSCLVRGGSEFVL